MNAQELVEQLGNKVEEMNEGASPIQAAKLEAAAKKLSVDSIMDKYLSKDLADHAKKLRKLLH